MGNELERLSLIPFSMEYKVYLCTTSTSTTTTTYNNDYNRGIKTLTAATQRSTIKRKNQKRISNDFTSLHFLSKYVLLSTFFSISL